MTRIFSLLLAFAITACGQEHIERPDTPMKDAKDAATDAATIPDTAETITLGAGCFWCVEAVFQQLEGVYSVTSGYMGGHIVDPTYEEVCTKTTGHIEVVQLKYDAEKISTETILEWFYKLHDPTTLNRQGNDVGPQYASAIFYHTPEQKAAAEAVTKKAQSDFDDPIVTVLCEAETYYEAEAEHQDYYFRVGKRNPYCRAVITPKLQKLQLRD